MRYLAFAVRRRRAEPAELIIDGYIAREVLKPLLTITVVLIVIFVGYSSGRYLSYAVDGVLQVETLASFIFIKMIIALEVLLPIALYLSIVLGLGRLESLSEITAARACGIGNGRVMRIVVGIAFVLALLVACISMFARPLAYEKSYWIKAQAEAELELDRLKSGVFYDSEQRQRTIFVDDVDQRTGRLQRVFIRGERGGIIHIIYAQSGEQKIDPTTGARSLILTDVHVYFLGRHGAKDKGVAAFKQMTLGLSAAQPITLGYKRKAAPTVELARSEAPMDIAEYQWRLSTPVSTVLLGVLAVILSRASPRSSRYTKTIGAVVLYAIYYNLSAMAKTWVETEVVGKFPGIWWVQCALVLVIAILLLIPRWTFRRAAKRRPTLVGAVTGAIDPGRQAL
ncbi:MAG: LPS export ABC transporter permease LptF [Proteobacteria bacterium]|nr:MAG: LPS export ABC transporter permease LptF [Pseudomonadota bacterium]